MLISCARERQRRKFYVISTKAHPKRTALEIDKNQGLRRHTLTLRYNGHRTAVRKAAGNRRIWAHCRNGFIFDYCANRVMQRECRNLHSGHTAQKSRVPEYFSREMYPQPKQSYLSPIFTDSRKYPLLSNLIRSFIIGPDCGTTLPNSNQMNKALLWADLF